MPDERYRKSGEGNTSSWRGMVWVRIFRRMG